MPRKLECVPHSISPLLAEFLPSQCIQCISLNKFCCWGRKTRWKSSKKREKESAHSVSCLSLDFCQPNDGMERAEYRTHRDDGHATRFIHAPSGRVRNGTLQSGLQVPNGLLVPNWTGPCLSGSEHALSPLRGMRPSSSVGQSMEPRLSQTGNQTN